MGDEYHCLGLLTDTRPAPSNGRGTLQRTRLHHIAFEVDTGGELAGFAARLNESGIELALQPCDGNPDIGDTLWFDDPDRNRVEISVTPDDSLTLPPASSEGRRTRLHPHSLQHLAIRTMHMEIMVDFYTEALGFDISDWLLRECVWLRCNSDHHTLILIEGKQDIDHIGYIIPPAPELLPWADYFTGQHAPILWGPSAPGAWKHLF